jgi:hypothetical protein
MNETCSQRQTTKTKIGCVSIRLRNITQHSKDMRSHHVDNIVWSIKICKML